MDPVPVKNQDPWFSWRLILQLVSLLVYLQGVVACFFVMFAPLYHFSGGSVSIGVTAGSFSTGLAGIALVVLMIGCELTPLPHPEFFQFVDSFYGKGAMMFLLGCTHAGERGIFLASVIIFWVLAAANVALGFLGFAPSPPLTVFREQQGSGRSGRQTPYDAIPPAQTPAYEARVEYAQVAETYYAPPPTASMAVPPPVIESSRDVEGMQEAPAVFPEQGEDGGMYLLDS
jgi:hypothetical protein